jgi:putative methyltransferase (TIGR04325 family)
MTERSSVSTPLRIWNGPFKTWDEACAAVPDQGDAFVSARWMDRIVQQLKEFREAYATEGLALPPRPCNLPMVCALTRSASIVDFGGSSGWCYDYLERTLKNTAIASYVIVEISHTAEHMKRSGLHPLPVAYKTIENSLPQCDLLYCNSVLQYFESNTEFLDLIKRVRPRYILLDDLLAMGENDFFATQTYYHTAIPHRFLGLQRLLSDAASAGYEPLASTPFASPILGAMNPLPMDNFPEEFRLRYSLSVLLERTKST